MNTKTISLLLLLAVFFLPVVAAQDTIFNPLNGLFVYHNEDDTIQQYQNFTFSYQTLDADTGQQVFGASCEFEIYDDEGEYVLQIYKNIDADEGEVHFFINGGNFTKLGQYTHVVYCNKTIQGGASFSTFIVSPVKYKDTSYIWLIIFGFCTFAFLTVGIILPGRKWIAKSALFTASLLSLYMVMGVGMLYTISPELRSIGLTGQIMITAIISIVVLVTLVYYFMYIIGAIRDAKKNKTEEKEDGEEE